jgi:potassium voltage-gated channel Eag-related subfamily H protein 7
MLDDDIDQTCLLDPRTVAMGRWDGWVTLLLIFTTYVTPYEVAYLGNECHPVAPSTACSASERWGQMTEGAVIMFLINRIVDLSFFGDMIKTFFVSYFDEKRQEWISDHGVIAKRYLKFWFLIDLVSIMPFDMMSFFTSNEALENAKGARLIRLLRLLKLLRILRGARILAKWQDHFGW